MQDRMRRAHGLLFTFVLASGLISACSGDDGPADVGTTPDTGAPVEDSGTVADTGVNAQDAGFEDTGVAADTGVETDAGVVTLDPEIVPGSHVQVAEGKVTVNLDTFASVRSTLGAGVRTAVDNTRSYEWSLSGGVELTVWFANSNLDGDDAAPNDVDDTDRVLWIAVQGGFTGATDSGIGLGSTRAEVTTAMGAADNESPIADPAGTLLQYYTTGMLVALDAQDAVRTLTVHRAYGAAPDGTIDARNRRLRFTGTDIEGQDGLQTGTNRSRVQALFGAPDAQGDLQFSGQTLQTWSYGFIGMEFFFLDGRDTVLFMSVHTPYFGQSTTGVGIGSTRQQMEDYLQSEGFSAGSASNSNPNLICYPGARDVGVTYSSDNLVTSITMPLLACP